MLKVYGISVSYYTGKLEAYLRIKGLRYELESPYSQAAKLRPHVGAIQVPMVLREDGRYMSDSTPIIQQLEREHPDPAIFPDDSVVRFVALLIEDYADEWLWRAAMHYRWSYEHDRELLSRILTDEILGFLRAPRFLKLRRIRKRQLTGFVLEDGVTATTREHVEAGYRAALANMTAALADRPFLLGESPSIADIGMMGPMLRHFGQDPTPAEIMRNEAPAVWEWVARVWHGGHLPSPPRLLHEIPADLDPMLREIAETHLAQLAANARAFDEGARRFDMTAQGCEYRDLPVSRYRVHCLERLREEFAELEEAEQNQVRALLPHADGAVLWDGAIPADSGYDPERRAPFNRAINVYEGGAPR